jgi:hypothetical protein
MSDCYFFARRFTCLCILALKIDQALTVRCSFILFLTKTLQGLKRFKGFKISLKTNVILFLYSKISSYVTFLVKFKSVPIKISLETHVQNILNSRSKFKLKS